VAQDAVCSEKNTVWAQLLNVKLVGASRNQQALQG